MLRFPSYVKLEIEKIACRRCGAQRAACINPQEHEVFASVAFHDQDHRSEFCYERMFDYFESFRLEATRIAEQPAAKLYETEQQATVKLYETHDGLVLCAEHFVAAFEEMSPPDRDRVHSSKGNGHELVMDAVTRDVFKPRCAMCGQFPSPGRNCLGCTTPLHPLWPACYCSNECALRDDDAL